MIKKLFNILPLSIIAFIISTSFVNADTSITIGLFTDHPFTDIEYNNDNKVIGIKHNDFFMTTFENSVYKRSYFAGYRFDTKKYMLKETNLYVKGNIYVGLITGYEDYLPTIGNAVSPAALPSVEVGYKNYSLEVLAAPLGMDTMYSIVFNINF